MLSAHERVQVGLHDLAVLLGSHQQGEFSSLHCRQRVAQVRHRHQQDLCIQEARKGAMGKLLVHFLEALPLLVRGGSSGGRTGILSRPSHQPAPQSRCTLTHAESFVDQCHRVIPHESHEVHLLHAVVAVDIHLGNALARLLLCEEDLHLGGQVHHLIQREDAVILGVHHLKHLQKGVILADDVLADQVLGVHDAGAQHASIGAPGWECCTWPSGLCLDTSRGICRTGAAAQQMYAHLLYGQVEFVVGERQDLPELLQRNLAVLLPVEKTKSSDNIFLVQAQTHIKQ